MELQELQKDIHETAVAKGWWESPRSPLEIHMLIVSEIAEATEEARNGTPDVYQISVGKEMITPDDPKWDDSLKMEGEAVELADAMIRILDYCGRKNWDIQQIMEMKHKFNKTRPQRHGGKKF